MRVGDVIESAIWLTGEESDDMRKRYESEVIDAIDYFCHEKRFIHSQIVFIEKKPGTDRVPEVPDHIQGQNVRLLVAEALIVGKSQETPKGSFVANLDKIDLERLRSITRKARYKLYKEHLTDAECDRVIEEIGPEAAIATLRNEVKPFGLLH